MSSCAVGRIITLAAALGFVVASLAHNDGLGWLAAGLAAIAAATWSFARRHKVTAACAVPSRDLSAFHANSDMQAAQITNTVEEERQHA